MRISHDILIAGGGVAGLTAAAAFGAAGFSVLCLDPGPVAATPTRTAADLRTTAQTAADLRTPAQTAADLRTTARTAADLRTPTQTAADLRTTAFLQPARALLDACGLWPRLAPFATPLQVMRIVDVGGTAPVTRDFDAAELGDLPFGWNLPNWLLRRELAAHLAGLAGVTYRPGTSFAGMLARDDGALVRLDDGSQVAARLVIGADGRDSAVRRAAGIGVRTRHHGQKALVFAVTHATPHDNISTEVHRQGGPFTLVPLPDLDGRPCSSVVWMDDGPAIVALAALEPEAFALAATERSAGVLGSLTLASARQVWPIITQLAHAMSAPRVALMAEAAHVLPPIGAQGLNTSLADLACLLNLVRAAPGDPGAPRVLAAYARRRHPQVMLRAAGVDALNQASMAGSDPLRALRAAGLRALHDIAPVRRALMRLGVGA